jgi:hypothetical protein
MVGMAVVVADDLESRLALLPLDSHEILRGDLVAHARRLALAVLHAQRLDHASRGLVGVSHQHAADLERISRESVGEDLVDFRPGDPHFATGPST